jgi:CRISPR system Cascade subunit CasD
LSEKTQMAVRCDAPGRLLTDYHTVGGGYNEPMLLTAQGKPKKSSGRPHTELTWRDYLCDASFLVVLQSEDETLIEQMAEALQTPVWPVFLGRKSCPPTRPVFDGVGQFKTMQEALERGTWSLTVKPPKTGKVRCVLETNDLDGVRHRDQILSRQYRQFGPRYTKDADPPLSIVVSDSDLTGFQNLSGLADEDQEVP